VKFIGEAGTHVHRRDLCTAQVANVDAGRPIPVCAEGDEFAQLLASARIRKSAIEIICPA
jgi:hypothetical protein